MSTAAIINKKYGNDKIWYNQPSVLLKRPIEIFPINLQEMKSAAGNERIINSIVRLTVYVVLGTFLLSRSMIIQVIIAAIIVLVITVLWYENKQQVGEIPSTIPTGENDNIPLSTPPPSNPNHSTETFGVINIPTRLGHPKKGNNSIEAILNDMNGTFKTQRMVEPDKEYRYFGNQLNRDRVKNQLFSNNRSGRRPYGAQQHEQHIKAMKDMYNGASGIQLG